MKSIYTIYLLLFGMLLHAQMPNKLSPAEKLYGLSKFWQEANYNFVYMNKVDKKQWDGEYMRLLGTITQTKNDHEYYRELQKFCAILKDGHTNVYLPDGMETMINMFGEYRLFIENIDGKAIIVRVNESKKNEIPPGSEIIEVNGLTTQQYIDSNVKPYIASSTDYILQNWSTSRLLEGLDGDTYIIKIKTPDQKIATLNLKHKSTPDKEVYPPFDKNRELIEFKWLENNIAYVGLNGFDNDTIVDLFKAKIPELRKAKGLIIDLRYNGGGSSQVSRAIMECLTNDKVLYGAKESTKEYYPAFKAWGSYLEPNDTINGKSEWGMTKAETLKAYKIAQNEYYHTLPYKADNVKYKGKRIVVPTAILIGNNTASAAEDFLIYADKQKHMVKIGEKTFGSTGEPYVFELPGGGFARVCTKKDTYPDGREFVGVGIIPDIEVKMTVDDYLSKKDPVLEKAASYISNKVK